MPSIQSENTVSLYVRLRREIPTVHSITYLFGRYISSRILDYRKKVFARYSYGSEAFTVARSLRFKIY
jgi:hypothetical protein